MYQLNKGHGCHHIETSHLNCRVNQLTGFYMMETLAFNELKTDGDKLFKDLLTNTIFSM